MHRLPIFKMPVSKLMFDFNKGLEKVSKLTPIQTELIRLRASMINRCAFCLDMHVRDALKAGETQQRIAVLPGWRETDLFSKEEQALLSLTEEMTLISRSHVSNETYKNAAEILGDERLAHAIMAVVEINAWNRIAITAEIKPEKE